VAILNLSYTLRGKLENYLSQLCKCLLYLTHGFLRVGEIAYTKPGQAHQIIGLKDATVVIVGDLQSIKVRINHSKNDQRGKGVYIYI
jgi:hypothetical protein